MTVQKQGWILPLWLCKISVNSISRELYSEVESKYQLLENFTIHFRKVHMHAPTFIHLWSANNTFRNGHQNLQGKNLAPV